MLRKDNNESKALKDVAADNNRVKRASPKPAIGCLFSPRSNRRATYHEISTNAEPKGCGCVIA